MLKNKLAFVTGASRGIGQAIATHLGKAGARVVGTATSEKGADSITTHLKSEGVSGQGISLDVSDPQSIEHALSQISDLYGAPEILVNNAGITQDNLLLRLTPAQWDAVIQTNLTGVYLITQGCIRGMLKAKWGRVIHITSIVGATGNAGQTNYAAAKAGVVGFSKSLAQEVASRHITINCVAPGFIQTDMTQKLTESQTEQILSQIPMNQMGTVEDIAYAVCFLASEQARYITGETLHINGGMYMP